MIRLPVQFHDLLHLLCLRCLPRRPRHQRRLRHDQHARLNLVDVRVPQTALLSRQGCENSGCDHVFYADKAGALAGRIVNEALTDVCRGGISSSKRGEYRERVMGFQEPPFGNKGRAFVQVGTIVICLHAAGWVGGVDMESVKVRANGLDGTKILLAGD